MTRFFVAGLALVTLVACGESPGPGAPSTSGDRVVRNNWDPATGSISGGVSSGSLFSFGGSGNRAADGSQIAVNAYLWRGALETLKFMPLASADPFGGVIITDWWTPPTSPDERFKATAYILGGQLRADGVHVSLFRQVRQDGQWVDAPVDPGKGTELENVVLAKARDLRVQSASSQ